MVKIFEKISSQQNQNGNFHLRKVNFLSVQASGSLAKFEMQEFLKF
jgi:hypothetical protein